MERTELVDSTLASLAEEAQRTRERIAQDAELDPDRPRGISELLEAIQEMLATRPGEDRQEKERVESLMRAFEER